MVTETPLLKRLKWMVILRRYLNQIYL